MEVGSTDWDTGGTELVWLAHSFPDEAESNLLPKLVYSSPKEIAGILLDWNMD